MTGSVELDPDGTHLLVRFPYREDLVALVKDLPQRRWNPRDKSWRVPIAHTDVVYATFSRHLFEFSSEVSQLLAGTLGTAAATGDADAISTQTPTAAEPDAEEAEAVTISQLNTRVRDGLRQLFPEALWVTGEVVDFDKSADRQHRFFQLVEKAPGQARARATVETALFGGTAEWLLPRLAAGDDPFTLRDGIEIRARVRVDLYPASGRFQIVVQDIDPTHTLGKLALTREQILRELKQLGIADRNRARPFAVPALRIGVLTSAESDGWNDFVRHLEEAQVGLDLTLFPIKVQGTELKPSLLRGLQWFADRFGDFDLLCILRGGGSRTDLAWFDDREVAVEVGNHPLKIVVGIGHQRDQSVLDAIAHSEKTPTAVAALLAEGVLAARRDVLERADRLQDAALDLLDHERRDLGATSRAVVHGTEQLLERQRRRLATAGRELQSTTLLRLGRERSELRRARFRIEQGVARQLERAKLQLDARADRQRLLDPAGIVARGFTLTRDAAGKIVTSAAKVAVGDTLCVEFRDGSATSRVEDVKRDNR